ncbi:hypothetical protein D915_001528 [Fasciola hepatica]|uniref:Uncharacterized protein n=1 Tax=Fasciola hepatica TaxID=6192 RepID=A0A4E0RJ76_FASHE|nr:hypothetical protein D915_001528 [Fasciola hepatica]
MKASLLLLFVSIALCAADFCPEVIEEMEKCKTTQNLLRCEFPSINTIIPLKRESAKQGRALKKMIQCWKDLKKRPEFKKCTHLDWALTYFQS